MSINSLMKQFMPMQLLKEICIFWQLHTTEKKLVVLTFSNFDGTWIYFNPKIKLINDFVILPHIYYTSNYWLLRIDKYQLKNLYAKFIYFSHSSFTELLAAILDKFIFSDRIIHWCLHNSLGYFPCKGHCNPATCPSPFKIVMIT